MTQLHEIFTNFLNGQRIFKNRDALSISFTPETILHREKQIEELGKILAPALIGCKPSNVFIYGRTGTGKSLVSMYVAKELMKVSRENGSNVKVIYVNCKMKKVTDTEYRILAYILNEFGEKVPFTGLPTEELYKRVVKKIDEKEQVVILILDEIDALVEKVGDEILYNITRLNQELKKAKLSIIGITNDLHFITRLDPRIKSSLSEEELVFPPYNANQLKDILEQRAKIAFHEGVVDKAVIEKCAAIAAQEHGDARRALDLLRVAGEIAERRGDKKVTVEHVDMAHEKIERDTFIETIKHQPLHSQLVFYSILELLKTKKEVTTGDVIDFYLEVCKKLSIKPVTERRISDLIAELSFFGFIDTKVVSKGRYGRTRIITLRISKEIEEKIYSMLLEKFY
ncbi:MAG TPA: ORC1-type DNA replication protein [Nanoarchaeota archaeon]|nr:ORC1-type DNA replication protein [Nanoarchaeota archaeon]